MKNAIVLDGKEYLLSDEFVVEFWSKVGKETKELTHEEIKELLFSKFGHVYSTIHCSKQEQLEKLIAINKMLDEAIYLNDGWIPDWGGNDKKYYFEINYYGALVVEYTSHTVSSHVYFKTIELALRCVSILGEDVIRTALTMDY